MRTPSTSAGRPQGSVLVAGCGPSARAGAAPPPPSAESAPATTQPPRLRRAALTLRLPLPVAPHDVVHGGVDGHALLDLARLVEDRDLARLEQGSLLVAQLGAGAELGADLRLDLEG